MGWPVTVSWTGRNEEAVGAIETGLFKGYWGQTLSKVVRKCGYNFCRCWLSQVGFIYLSQHGNGSLVTLKVLGLEVYWQMLNQLQQKLANRWWDEEDCLSPLVEEADKNMAGRQDLIQMCCGAGQGFRPSKELKYSAEKLRKKPIYMDLANMAWVETSCSSVGTGQWGSPSSTGGLLFIVRQKMLSGSCWSRVRLRLGLWGEDQSLAVRYVLAGTNKLADPILP